MTRKLGTVPGHAPGLAWSVLLIGILPFVQPGVRVTGGISAPVTKGGALDPSFGTGGMASFQFYGVSETSADAVLIQPDGKIAPVGWSQSLEFGGMPATFALARLNPDGSPDPGFGTGGAVTAPLGEAHAAV